jgi:hypothetical protein
MDDKSKRTHRDTNRISLGDDLAIRYWMGRCEVGKTALIEAVKAVGNKIGRASCRERVLAMV